MPLRSVDAFTALVFSFDAPLSFVVSGTGKAAVHVSGYFQPGPDDEDDEDDMMGDEDDEDDEDDDEDDEDEGEVPAKAPAGAPAKTAADAKAPAPGKAAVPAPVKAAAPAPTKSNAPTPAKAAPSKKVVTIFIALSLPSFHKMNANLILLLLFGKAVPEVDEDDEDDEDDDDDDEEEDKLDEKFIQVR